MPGQLNLLMKFYQILLFYTFKLRWLNNMRKVHGDRLDSVCLITLIRICQVFWLSNLTHLFELSAATMINTVSYRFQHKRALQIELSCFLVSTVVLHLDCYEALYYCYFRNRTIRLVLYSKGSQEGAHLKQKVHFVHVVAVFFLFVPFQCFDVVLRLIL